MNRDEMVAAAAEAMEQADEQNRLVGWDCFADETIVDWPTLAAAVDAVLESVALREALAAYREARIEDDQAGEANNGGNFAGDELADAVAALLAGELGER